jgi:hypothetical protein
MIEPRCRRRYFLDASVERRPSVFRRRRYTTWRRRESPSGRRGWSKVSPGACTMPRRSMTRSELCIARCGHGDDLVQAKPLEAVTHDGARRFGGISLPPRVERQAPGNLHSGHHSRIEIVARESHQADERFAAGHEEAPSVAGIRNRRYFLRRATPSVFHQRHIGRVLRSSCNDRGRRLAPSRGPRTSSGPMPSSLAG